MLTYLSQAIQEMYEYGLDVVPPNFIRCQFVEGKKHNIAGSYNIQTHGDKVCGVYGAWHGDKDVKVFNSDNSTTKMSEAQVAPVRAKKNGLTIHEHSLYFQDERLSFQRNKLRVSRVMTMLGFLLAPAPFFYIRSREVIS